MRVATVCPRCRNTCGSRATPTPPGVPVTIRSPGTSVVNVEMYSIRAIGSKHSSDVFELCITCPSTVHEIWKWAGASAEGSTLSEGTLTTLQFPVTCAGYAQAFPQGREVTLRVVSATAYDELVQPLAVQTVDATLDLNCTTVSTAEGASFGTVKALFGRDAGGR